MNDSPLIRHNIGYKTLFSYQKAETIYDITYYFCDKYLQRGDRTIDQMVQAARSGKQNIIEGCVASATSTATRIRLFNVAKASLHELLADYEDYLRVRGLPLWKEQSPEVMRMRKLGREHNDTAFYMPIVRRSNAATIANMAIVLIHQVDFLLYRQLQNLAAEFTAEGGFREKMTRVRLAYREKE